MLVSGPRESISSRCLLCTTFRPKFYAEIVQVRIKPCLIVPLHNITAAARLSGRPGPPPRRLCLSARLKKDLAPWSRGATQRSGKPNSTSGRPPRWGRETPKPERSVARLRGKTSRQSMQECVRQSLWCPDVSIEFPKVSQCVVCTAEDREVTP